MPCPPPGSPCSEIFFSIQRGQSNLLVVLVAAVSLTQLQECLVRHEGRSVEILETGVESKGIPTRRRYILQRAHCSGSVLIPPTVARVSDRRMSTINTTTWSAQPGALPTMSKSHHFRSIYTGSSSFNGIKLPCCSRCRQLCCIRSSSPHRTVYNSSVTAGGRRPPPQSPDVRHPVGHQLLHRSNYGTLSDPGHGDSLLENLTT